MLHYLGLTQTPITQSGVEQGHEWQLVWNGAHDALGAVPVFTAVVGRPTVIGHYDRTFVTAQYYENVPLGEIHATSHDHAHNAGRGVDFYGNNDISDHKNSAYEYGWEATLPGLTVGSKPGWLTSSQATYYLGSRLHHGYWGDNDDPLYASITYTDGS